MADLQAMFQNIGPTSAALMSGIQQGQAFNANETEQAMRQAQMDKILMETDQAKLMNPLTLQAKQQEVASADLRAKQEKEAYRDDILGKAIPKLSNISGPARYAAVDQIFAQAGMPLDDADRQHLFSMDPDAMLKELKAKHEWSITQNKGYRQAMDVAEMQRKSAEKIAAGHDVTSRYGVDARAQLAKDRAALDKSLSQDLSAAKNYQAQSVVYTNHAEKARLAGDDAEYTRLTNLAQQATAQDLLAKSAAGDARAAQQLQLLQGLGVPLNNVPPAAPAAPAPAGGPRKPLSAY